MKRWMIGLAVWLCGCAGGESVVGPGPLSAFGGGVGHYLQGVVADDQGDLQMALEGYLGTLREDPGNEKVRRRGYEVALVRGQFDTAVDLVRTMPAAARDAMLPRLVTLTDAVRAGQWAEARHVANQLRHAGPDVLPVHALALTLEVGTRAVSATTAVADLMAVRVPLALRGRKAFYAAQLWLLDGAREPALRALEDARRDDAGMIWANQELLAFYGEARRVDLMQGVLKDLALQNQLGGMVLPTAPSVISRDAAVPVGRTPMATMVGRIMADFGLLAWTQGATFPARQMMALASVLMPKDPFGLYFGGMVEEFGGDLARAEAFYQLSADQPLTAVAARLRLVEVAQKRGDKAEVQQRLAPLLREAGRLPAVQLLAAEMAMNEQNYERAEQAYMALWRLLPDDAMDEARAAVAFRLGVVCERQGRYGDAARWLQRSLRLQPANAQVLNYLGYMWVEQGSHVAAGLDLLRQALFLSPQDGAIVDSVGWAYFKLEQYDKALVYLERAAEMEPTDATVTEHLGDVYEKLGKAEDARRLWRQALELNDALGALADKALGQRLREKMR